MSFEYPEDFSGRITSGGVSTLSGFLGMWVVVSYYDERDRPTTSMGRLDAISVGMVHLGAFFLTGKEFLFNRDQTVYVSAVNKL